MINRFPNLDCCNKTELVLESILKQKTGLFQGLWTT